MPKAHSGRYKIKDHIRFDPENHTYYNTKSKKFYVSGTGLINQLTPKFEATYEKTAKTRDLLGFSHEQVLNYWDRKRNNASIRGSYIHDAMEYMLENKLTLDDAMAYLESLDQTVPTSEVYKYYKFVRNYLRDRGLLNGKIIVEDLLYDDELELASQADLIILTKNGIYVFDYKTNECELTYKGYDKMYPPFEKYDNSKLFKYDLQLNLYGKLASDRYELPICGLEIFHLYEEPKVIEIKYNLKHVKKLCQKRF